MAETETKYEAGESVWVFYPSKATAIGATIDAIHPGGDLVDVTIVQPDHELDGSKTTIPFDGIWKKQE